MVHVRVDHQALVRGRVEAGEVCEIPGVGPIPVEVARRLAVDSILSVLVIDGVDVTAVAYAGRTIPASIRRALRTRSGRALVPGCGLGEGLEIDHIEPFAQGGTTTLANLVRLCHWHHYLKTHHRYRLERNTAAGYGSSLADRRAHTGPSGLRVSGSRRSAVVRRAGRHPRPRSGRRRQRQRRQSSARASPTS